MYKLIKIEPYNSNWWFLHFQDEKGAIKIVTVENISGLKDVYMAGIV